MIAAAFLFTSIQNYSYSFDRNPMESEVEKEECDDSQEDEGDGTATMKIGYRLTSKGIIDPVLGPIGPVTPGFFNSEWLILCCIKSNTDALCDRNMQKNVEYCPRERIPII